MFLLHCLIYKVHATSQRVSYILAQLLAFVKNFFQVFQKFFQNFLISRIRSFLFAPRLATALIEYHPFQEMSSSFFKFFRFFEILSFLKEFISEARILPFPKRPQESQGAASSWPQLPSLRALPLIYFRNIPKHQVAHKKSALHP